MFHEIEGIKFCAQLPLGNSVSIKISVLAPQYVSCTKVFGEGRKTPIDKNYFKFELKALYVQKIFLGNAIWKMQTEKFASDRPIYIYTLLNQLASEGCDPGLVPYFSEMLAFSEVRPPFTRSRRR